MNNSATLAPISPKILAWCGEYADFAFTLAKWFLILALLVALVETALLLWGKIKALLAKPEPPKENSQKGLAPDPVKLIDALKGLLETLKGLPTWVAIFLAGLALLWMATQQPEACKPPQGASAAGGAGRGAAGGAGAGTNAAPRNQAAPSGCLRLCQ